ncbi:putative CAP domain-containing protein [Helianthus annuus]|nr:putative CAP domain-containing protein [Helianthus annuus]KAJ0821459.1 putative CAP superfamily protein [Helianthus annuus]
MALNRFQQLAIFLLTVSWFIDVSIASGLPFLIPHNEARAQVGVRPLTWNETLATYAREYAYQRSGDCKLQHSGGPFGENLALGYGDQFTTSTAVGMWVDEKQYYDYYSNSCVGKGCLHYTQVVWSDSVHLGCAKVNCYNDGWWFVICSYDPPGNYVGERPY